MSKYSLRSDKDQLHIPFYTYLYTLYNWYILDLQPDTPVTMVEHFLFKPMPSFPIYTRRVKFVHTHRQLI